MLAYMKAAGSEAHPSWRTCMVRYLVYTKSSAMLERDFKVMRLLMEKCGPQLSLQQLDERLRLRLDCPDVLADNQEQKKEANAFIAEVSKTILGANTVAASTTRAERKRKCVVPGSRQRKNRRAWARVWHVAWARPPLLRAGSSRRS